MLRSASLIIKCETGQWPKDFTEVTMTALEKMPKAAKCSDHGTISLMVHTVKIVGRRVRRRIERKIEDVFVEDQFGTRKVNELGKKFGCRAKYQNKHWT